MIQKGQCMGRNEGSSGKLLNTEKRFFKVEDGVRQ